MIWPIAYMPYAMSYLKFHFFQLALIQEMKLAVVATVSHFLSVFKNAKKIFA